VKIRVTFELTDTERVVIGAIKGGQLQPATREQVEAYAREIVEAALTSGVRKLEAVQAQLVTDIGGG